MIYQTAHEEVRARCSDRERIADLLSRYPRLSHHETGEIVTFLRTGRHLDIGMLTSSERLRPHLDAFMADHRSHFRVKWGEGSAVIGGIVALQLMLAPMWKALS
jgi:hypothetical protein